MMNEMKKNELNEQEMENVTGGGRLLGISHSINDQPYKQDEDPGLIEGVVQAVSDGYDAVSDAASTAWEVVKYVFDVFG